MPGLSALGLNQGTTPGLTVVGVGIDVVAIDRFVTSLERTPGLRQRLFSAAEQVTASGSARSGASLAARFAVKEAVAKALGVPRGMKWQHCSVRTSTSGRPELAVTGTVAAAAERAGVTGWQLSISHDAGIAAAVVLAMGPVISPVSATPPDPAGALTGMDTAVPTMNAAAQRFGP